MIDAIYHNHYADPIRPYRNLLAEILNRSLRDLLNPTKAGQKERRDAEYFFFCGETNAFSFIWICQQLEIKPDVILQRIKSGERMPDF